MLMRRTKAQALDTRATILDAAEAMFFSHGVTQTTLDEIADAANAVRDFYAAALDLLKGGR